jgi:2'-hydroxyisoflavone reductase
MIDRRGVLRGSLALGAAAWLGAERGRIFASEAPRVPKSILMLGGTGFLGPQTVEAALKRGHTVTLFNRGKTRPGLFPDLEKLRGDRETADYKALDGRAWDAVVDTSANVPRWVNQAAAVIGAKVGQYVYVSSVSVYPDLSRPGTDETAPVATLAPGTDPNTETITGETYGALKALSEQAAEKAMPTRVTVVRPGLIVGPDDPTDRFTYWPVRVARGGEVLAPGSPDDPIQLIDVRDLGAFLVTLIENQTLGTFNALGPTPALSMGRILHTCKTASGSDARFTWVPADFLAKHDVHAWSDMPAWVPHEGETAGFMHVSNAKAIAAGLVFRPIKDTAKATLEWFRTEPEERQQKLRAGIAPDRERNVLAAWKARG